MNYKLEIYPQRRVPFTRKQYRWRLRDKRNGRIVAASTEGYYNMSDLISNLYADREALIEALPIHRDHFHAKDHIVK